MDYVECLGLSADELPVLLELLRSAPSAGAGAGAGAADAIEINSRLVHGLLSLDTRRLALVASRQPSGGAVAAGERTVVGLSLTAVRRVRAASSTVSLVELGVGVSAAQLNGELNGGLAPTATATGPGREAELANLFRIGATASASARDQFCYAERLSQAFATDEGIVLSLFLRYPISSDELSSASASASLSISVEYTV